MMTAIIIVHSGDNYHSPIGLNKLWIMDFFCMWIEQAGMVNNSSNDEHFPEKTTRRYNSIAFTHEHITVKLPLSYRQ